MIISATWVNNVEDYNNVVESLQNRGIYDYETHEYFNREYWRQRVRRGTPPPDVLSSNIQKVCKYIFEEEEAYKPHINKELRKWFETFAENAEKGMYQIPYNLDFYKYDGEDQDGLSLYKTDLGTNLNETLHQKYSDLVGNYSIGIETANILLVLRSF